MGSIVSSRHPLKEVSEHVRNHTGVAVIFDLDSTLFSVSPRTQAILRQLGADPAFRARFEAQADILKDVEVLPTDWGVRQALARTPIMGEIELFETIRDYWREHFFASPHLEHDDIYPAANEHVRHLEELGAEILYLTGRSEARMREGTEAALKRWDFPYRDPAHLMMKPSDVETDEGFKTIRLRELAPRYEHIWFFENEPIIIHEVRQALPQIRIVFMNSVHAGRAEPPRDLPQIGMSYREGLPE